ncbi:MAG TPA: LPXTG cell wall anchor domain-containing protein [Acidimicrobiia bacterium]|nr:LPXTG cell wall anchor domain-containing protein [Acidimicrobiia bacterium]
MTGVQAGAIILLGFTLIGAGIGLARRRNARL